MEPAHPTFIDLFAGCGGLSLGLMKAGWEGLFAIEHSPEAFKTLKHNLVDSHEHNTNSPKFAWPSWLDVGPHEVATFCQEHRKDLRKLRGKVNLVAGGPPCQGFSFAGRRTGDDPRNDLFEIQVKIVKILQPELVLIENVKGINSAFGAGKKRGRGRPPDIYALRIKKRLTKAGYIPRQKVVLASDFGVPQMRPRCFTFGIRADLVEGLPVENFFDRLYKNREGFLDQRSLPTERAVTVSEGLSDLVTKGKEFNDCEDEESPPGFKEIVYEGPLTPYQALMNEGMGGRRINSLRLVNHRQPTIDRFTQIQKTCRKGVQLTDEERAHFGIKKSALVPLSPDQPSHTVTTIPDDMLHYCEPRVHTAREQARLQSFPDWFEFKSKFTTGGSRRAKQCPRYTQIGNAVPPLLAEALGITLADIFLELCFSCETVQADVNELARSCTWQHRRSQETTSSNSS